MLVLITFTYLVCTAANYHETVFFLYRLREILVSGQIHSIKITALRCLSAFCDCQLVHWEFTSQSTPFLLYFKAVLQKWLLDRQYYRSPRCRYQWLPPIKKITFILRSFWSFLTSKTFLPQRATYHIHRNMNLLPQSWSHVTGSQFNI